MANELLENLDRLHTTELGVIRIKKNLSLNVENVIEWCKEKISLSNAEIIRKGKNWYITIDNCIITINAYSYTIITAHKENDELFYKRIRRIFSYWAGSRAYELPKKEYSD